MLPHFTMCFLYGFLSLLTHSNSEVSDLKFQTFFILLFWVLLLCSLFTLQWMDKNTHIYFIFTILFFMANRLTKYNTPDISEKLTPVTSLMLLGLVVQSAHKGAQWSTILFLSILAIDLVNINIMNEITEIEEFDSFQSLIPDTIFPTFDL